jgi:phosphate-selective porin OprO/OprP
MGGSSDGFSSTFTNGCRASASGTTCTIGLLPGGITSGIQTAYLSYQGWKGNYNGHPWNVAIEGGYSDTMYSLDEATSSNDLMFMERASPQVIANNLAAGDFRSNFGGRAYGDWFWAGAYVTGPVSGAMHAATGSVRAPNTTGGATADFPPDGLTEQLGGYARAAVHFGDTKQYSIHLGGDVLEVFEPPYDYVTGARSLSFADRPELRIDPTTIVGTNIQATKIAAAPFVGNYTNAIQNVTHAQVYSVEAAGNVGPLFVQGEYFWFNVERRNFVPGNSLPLTTVTGPTLHFNGGYIEAGWTLTGETRTYNAAAGAYNGIVPAHPWSWKSGDWGAWEIAGRYSVIDLNDRLGFPDAAFGGKQTIYSAGLNWYANKNIRFMLDYLHGNIDKPGGPTDIIVTGTKPPTAPGGLLWNVGAKFDAVAMRTQIAF